MIIFLRCKIQLYVRKREEKEVLEKNDKEEEILLSRIIYLFCTWKEEREKI